MSRLWIIGDSFWDRNASVEQGDCWSNNQHTQLPGTNWLEHFVTENQLDFNWGSNSWSMGGASNDWLVYGLDFITHHPQFNCDNDTVLIGFTTTDRRVVRIRSDKQFNSSKGWVNLHDLRTTIVNEQSMLLLYESLYMNKDKREYDTFKDTRKWSGDLLKSEIDYSNNNVDYKWEHFKQCSMLDGAISKSKSRGVNIVPHRGCMYLNSPIEDSMVDPDYDWHNTEIFSPPSFSVGLEHDRQTRLQTESIDEQTLPMKERWFSKYTAHMSPDGAKAYSDAFGEWWSQ
jgi:hypothetical protein